MKKINNKVGASVVTIAVASGLFTVPMNVLAETGPNAFPEIISFENGEVEEGANYKLDKENVTTKVVDGALHVEYGKSDWPGLKFLPKESDHWNLGEDGAVSFKITNPGENAITFYVKLYEGLLDGTEDAKSIVYKASIGAGETKTFNVALGGEMPSLGMHALPPNDAGTLMSYGWGKKDIDLSHITQMTFWQMYNTEVNTLIYDDIKIIENPTTDLSYMDDIVDEYGQYEKDEWVNKVQKDEDITGDIEIENEWLDKEIEEREESGDYTKYGGFKKEEYRQEATGRFYSKKVDGKWTLIDPEGYPFIASGLDIIRTADALTWVSGRERMFQDLPSQDGEFAEHYTTVTGIRPPEGFEGKPGTGFNYYTANLEKKYGDNWLEEWTKTSLKRFKAWGFTSLGCWSEPEIYFGQGEKNEMTYVANGWINEGRGTENVFATVKNLVRGGNIADPFDPKFRKATETMAKNLKDQGINEDEWCYGIYVDNEIDWGNGTVAEQHYSVIDGAFAEADAKDSPAKTEFIKILKGNYANIDALNEAWGTSLKSFEDLNAPYADYAKIPNSDKSEMLSAMADQYYRTVDEVLDEYLPNVLNMGSRIAEWGVSEEVIDACAKYVDVVSFNCYKDEVNQPWMFLERYDKPVIIGEFHFNAMDTGFFAPGLKLVNSQEERGESYYDYMKSLYESSQFVGAQWFQYYDQSILGRAWDGENNNVGFVDVADQPYQPLVDAAKEIHEKGYQMRFSFINAEKVDIKKANVELSKVDSTMKLEATVYPENATNKDITWKSSDEKVVVVDENGTITAVGDGSATVTATSKNNQYVLDTCGVTVTGFVEEIPVIFDKIDFENGDAEVSYNMAVAGVNAANATANVEEIDGSNRLNLVVNKVTGVDGESATVDFTPKESWSFGKDNPLELDLTNPNSHPIQARVNIGDDKGGLRTYYFNMAANESRTVSISEFGAVPNNWGEPDGFYGAVDTGIDTTNIKLVSVMIWEGQAGLPKETPVSLVVDNINVKVPSTINFDEINFENGDEEVSYDMALAGSNAANAIVDIKDFDGNNKLNLLVNKVTGVDGESATVDFTPKEGVWNFGENNPLKIDLTNPNNHPIQARVNIGDGKGGLRTYYFKMAANESRTVSISEFGAVANNWGDPDGFYGAVDTGIDTTNIKLVSVMMWEGDAELPKDTPVSLIVDNINVEVDDSEGEEEKEVLATTVVLDKEEVELLVDGTHKLTATVNPVNATDKSVKWTTSNSNTVTVDEEGNITAIGAGTAYVGVVSNANDHAVDYCKVVVSNPEKPETPDTDKPDTDKPDPEKPEVPDTEEPDTDKPDTEEPDEDKEPVTPNPEEDKEDLPQTGGMNNLYVLLAGLGAVVSGGTVVYRNKKRDKK